MGDQRNLILAVVLSIAILVGFQLLNPAKPDLKPTAETAMTPAPPPSPGQADVAVPGGETPAPDVAAPQPSLADTPVVPGTENEALIARETALAGVERITVSSDKLKGSISTLGGRIDDLTLVKYLVDLNPESDRVTLLSPKGATDAYFADFGWSTVKGGPAVPALDTQWAAHGKELGVGKPVTLSWDNGQGLKFTRTYALDENYLFTVTQHVENTSGVPVTLFPYGLIQRTNTPETSGFYILHEGPLGVLNGTLKEVDYTGLREDGPVKDTTTGGWMGITDKYWLTALVPDQKAEVKASFSHRVKDGHDQYQVDYLGQGMTVAAGQSVEVANSFFAGAKEVRVLDAYAEGGITNFDLAIDFGWFFYLTKPFLYALMYINGMIGNFGVAILVFTVIIKLCFFPLANKSYRSMSKMKKIQPEAKKLQERFKDDKVRMNQEMMALYKKEGVNPIAGCLPVIIQIPVFFSLYKVLYVSIEMRHAPFFGWIQDLSVTDPTTVFNLFGLIPWTPPDMLMIGVWPLIMGASMVLQQRLNPAPTDPVQAKMMAFLPIIFTFMLAKFPAGLVIYWAWNNTLSILQQWFIMRKMGVKA